MNSQRSNDEIRKITNQLSYFGHICRIEEPKLQKVIMKWDPRLK